ncbi:uncharacterized protein LOC107366424 [Tetranychus urticae]|uniref:uncharacterized protein LOC107366424 n=1 Tax=Tetranychus urticae TaxID=32264 RepID=UPI00077C0E3A|nr:uncharacterized protein LOC107366424 [Tetranychus urticae]
MFFKDDELERLEQLKWFPRLKILDVEGTLDNDFISNIEVKGLQFKCDYFIDLEDVICHNSSLEMLAIKELSNFFANEIQGPKMKQLFVNSIVSEFASCARYFPNLQRLHIERYDRSPFDDEFYVGPVLEKLEILEICFYLDLYGELEHYHGFSLADHCPRLKSAFHYIQTDQDFHVNSGSKSFLRDLVLQL